MKYSVPSQRGGYRIRTCEEIAPQPQFECGALDRSANPPRWLGKGGKANKARHCRTSFEAVLAVANIVE